MRFREITAPGDDYAYVERLMRESFPPDERRSAESQRRLLGRGAFHCMLIEHEGAPVGGVNWWALPGFKHCEHLAIEP